MAMRDALDTLSVRCFALGTPYPRPVHALCAPYFQKLGYSLSADDTLDILDMTDVP
jgi:maleate cis-trans isomerase